MRLWHYDMLDVLPRQQLLSQLRECVAIAKDIYEKGNTNHILINPIMDYNLIHFKVYCSLLLHEFRERKYNVTTQTVNKLIKYLGDINYYNQFYIENELYIQLKEQELLFENWHDTRYLVICIYNLYEKYLRGGIPQEEWDKIYHKYYRYIDY